MYRVRLIGLLLSVVVLLTVTACDSPRDEIRDCRAEIVSLMKEMLSSEAYADLYGLSQTANDTVAQLKKGIYDSPSAVYRLYVPKDELMIEGATSDDFSDVLKDYVTSKTYLSFVSRINMDAGVDAVSVSSVYCAQKSFVCADVVSETVFLCVFETGNPIVITFMPGNSDSVLVSGSFLINDHFKVGDAKQIEDSCKALGFDGVVAERET